MAESISVCGEADDEQICALNAAVSMIFESVICVIGSQNAELGCIFDIVLTGLDELANCEEMNCALSILFSMVIDILDCVEAPATV